ncbi:Calx-beta domain-containing protein, partial [Thiorhodococcus minor]
MTNKTMIAAGVQVRRSPAGLGICALVALALTPVADITADIGSGQFAEARDGGGSLLIDAGGETWGAGWGDVNGDGLPDLWLGEHQYTPTILLQQGGAGGFSDVIQSAVLDPNPHYRDDTHGVAWADFDNDGDEDLFEACGGGAGEAAGGGSVQEEWRNNFFVNNGTLLVELAQAYGVDYPRGRGRTPLWVDYDNDGLLDLVITALQTSAAESPSAIFRQQISGFTEVTSQVGFNAGSCENAMLTHLTPDGAPTLICGDTSQIGTIYDISTQPFTDIRSTVGNDIYNAYPFDLAISDFDGDLDFDVFAVVAPPNTAAALRLSTGDRIQSTLPPSASERGFSFTAPGDVTLTFGWETDVTQVSLGASGVNPPPEADPGLVPGNVWPHRLELTLSTSDTTLMGLPASRSQGIYVGYENGRWQVRVVDVDYGVNVLAVATGISTPQAFGSVNLTQGNPLPPILFENQNGLLNRTTNSQTFLDPVSAIQSFGRSVIPGDFDNDMDVDVYVGATGPVANVPNLMFDNQGDGTFRVVSAAGGASGHLLGKTDVATSVDFDLDGCLDIFVAQGAYPAPFSYVAEHQLFRNQCGSNHWIEVDLEGSASNIHGIGAVLYATTPDGRVQVREQSNGTHKHAQDFRRIHFGLGANQEVDLEVQWPSGVVDYFSDLSVDQVVLLTEGSGGTAPSYTLGVDDVTVSEGPAGQEAVLTLTLTPAPGSGEQVDVAYQTVAGTATAGSDYTTTSGTLSFLAGESEQTVTVPILDDATPEPSESFGVQLTSADTNAATGTVTILDDDSGSGPACGAPSYDPASDRALFIWNDCGTDDWHLRITGGGSGQYVNHVGSLVADAAFPAGSVQGVSVEPNDTLDIGASQIDFGLIVGGIYEDGIDFSLASGASACLELTSPTTLPVLAGANRMVVDPQVEIPGFGACGGGSTFSLGVDDVTVSEGPAGQEAVLTLTLTPAPGSGEQVEVAYQPGAGTATAGSDYTTTSGTLSFLAGESEQTVTVPILDDATPEPSESFGVQLTSADTNAATGTVTILDDDSGSGPACGAPSYDPASDRALFIWNDCGTDDWHLRITGGGSGQYVNHVGSLVADAAFPAGSVQGVSVEPNDTLDIGASQIDFGLIVGGIYEDGIDFSLASGASAC